MAGLKLPVSANREPSAKENPSSAFKRTNKSSPSTIVVDQRRPSCIDTSCCSSSSRAEGQPGVKLQPVCMRQHEFWAIDENVEGYQHQDGPIKMMRQPEYYEEEVEEEMLVFNFEEPKPISSSRRDVQAPAAVGADAPSIVKEEEEEEEEVECGSKTVPETADAEEKDGMRATADETTGLARVAMWLSRCIGRKSS